MNRMCLLIQQLNLIQCMCALRELCDCATLIAYLFLKFIPRHFSLFFAIVLSGEDLGQHSDTGGDGNRHNICVIR